MNDALSSNTRPKLLHYSMGEHLQFVNAMLVPWDFPLRAGCTQHEGDCHNLLTRVTSYLPGWLGAVSSKTDQMLMKWKEKVYDFWQT